MNVINKIAHVTSAIVSQTTHSLHAKRINNAHALLKMAYRLQIQGADMFQPPSQQPAAPQPGMGKAILFTVMGVLLPLLTLGIEAAMHLSGGAFFDPIPTGCHILVILLVPLSNVLLIYALSYGSVQHAKILALCNAFAIGIAFFYSVLYLPLAVISPLLMLWFGLGFLPLAPLASLIAAIWGRRLFRRMLAEKRAPDVPRVWGGVVLALAVLIAIQLPTTVTRIGLSLAASENAESQLRGIRMLGAVGDEDLLLRLCYARSIMPTDFVGLLLSWNDSVSTDQVRTVFYRVTGTPFNSVSIPEMRSSRHRRFWFDEDRGGEVVGARVDGVMLASSRIDGSVDAQASTGYLEWTMVFKNTSSSEQEGRGKILLPPGAVVSRVTLWVNGEEREAAFGGRSQVRQAYEKVVKQRRDPVLVTTAGKDRVLFQLFPIPANGGEMKVRIGMTVPMLLPDLHQTYLQLPSFHERNFEMVPAFAHTVWIESKSPIEATAGLKQEKINPHAYAVRGDIADAQLGQIDSLLKMQRDSSLNAVWSNDLKNKDGGLVVQRYSEQPAWAPQRVVLVVDGSRSMHKVKNEIAEALSQLPRGIQLGLLIVGDVPSKSVVVMPLVEAGVAEQIKRFSFDGGRDNLDALNKAWDWAAEMPNSAVIWIHGPQPMLFDSVESFQQRVERRPVAVKLFQIEAVTGSNSLLEKIDGITDITTVSRAGSVQQDIAKLFQDWQLGKKQVIVSREYLPAGSDEWIGNPKTSDHIVRLWAADQVAKRTQSNGNNQREAAIELAQRYQLVTAVTGAIVLESSQQYEDAGLKPVAAGSVPTIPEPETWLLICVVFGVLALRYGRRRTSSIDAV